MIAWILLAIGIWLVYMVAYGIGRGFIKLTCLIRGHKFKGTNAWQKCTRCGREYLRYER
ncbi:hypothetical protein D3C75_232690 [compost metagenome]